MFRQSQYMRYTSKNAASGMLRHVALVGTDVSEKRGTSIIMVTRINAQGTTLAVTRN
jgi:hypothetical protein